jgi:hypothetical protein
MMIASSAHPDPRVPLAGPGCSWYCTMCPDRVAAPPDPGFFLRGAHACRHKKKGELPGETARAARGGGNVRRWLLMPWFYSSDVAAIRASLARIEAAVGTVSKGVSVADLKALQSEVSRNTSVVGSALALIQGFAAQLAAAGTDPQALAALQAQLTANDDQLAAAVAANTPAAPSSSSPPPSSSSTSSGS